MIFMIFHFIYGMILPIDELIFFRGVGIPPTSKIFGIITQLYLPHVFLTQNIKKIDRG